MGGIFKSPDYGVDDSAEKAAEKKAEEERLNAVERKRRGLDGLVNTSYNGVMKKKENTQTGKKLLGE